MQLRTTVINQFNLKLRKHRELNRRNKKVEIQSCKKWEYNIEQKLNSCFNGGNTSYKRGETQIQRARGLPTVKPLSSSLATRERVQQAVLRRVRLLIPVFLLTAVFSFSLVLSRLFAFFNSVFWMNTFSLKYHQDETGICVCFFVEFILLFLFLHCATHKFSISFTKVTKL